MFPFLKYISFESLMPTELLAKRKIVKLISRLSLFLKLKSCLKTIERCLLYCVSACGDLISTKLSFTQMFV